MKTSQAGRDFIKSFEQCRLKAYPDPGTGGAPWTIGWGCTGPDVKPGMVITQAEADQRFDAKLAEFEADVSRLVMVPVSQLQFDALVSFTYNCGAANFEKSTLLRKLNAGDYLGASSEFPKWNRAAGKVLNGLTTRRYSEQFMFLKGAKDKPC